MSINRVETNITSSTTTGIAIDRPAEDVSVTSDSVRNSLFAHTPKLASGALSGEHSGNASGETQSSEDAYGLDQNQSDTPAGVYGSSDGGSPGGPAAKSAARVPQREPWMQHENLDPQSFLPSRTRAGMQQVDLNDESDFDTFENITQNSSDRMGGRAGAGSQLGGQGNSAYDARGSSSPSYQNGDIGYGDYDPGEVEYDDDDVNSYPDSQMQGTSNAIKAYNFFLGKGYSPEQASGIVGVLQGESYARLDPTADQGDGGNAHGIAQWNRVGSPDRHAAFRKRYGKEILQGSFDEQLDFIGYELKTEGQSKQADKLIRSYKTPANASVAQKEEIVNKSAAAFDRLFERSYLGMRGKHQVKQGYARSFYREAKKSFPKDELETLPTVDSVNTAGEGAGDISIPEGPGGTDVSTLGNGKGRVNEIQGRVAGTRNKPLDKRLVAAISKACQSSGIDMFTCTSGGQPAAPGGPRTGSNRHDNGRAADGYFTIGKRKLDSKQSGDRALIQKFIYNFAMQNKRAAIGHATNYMNQNQGGKRAMFHIDLHGSTVSRDAIWYWGGARSKWTKDYPDWLGKYMIAGNKAGRNR